MLLQDLKDIRNKLDTIIRELDVESPVPLFERKPLPANAKHPYDACNAMWSAAQRDYNVGKGWIMPDGTAFNIFNYIEGLQQSGVHRIPPKSPEQMNIDIIALGFTPDAQKWLSDDSNASQLDPYYQRHFLGYVAVRKNQQDHTQGFNRIP